ncbi:MAG: N-acetyltransferase [Planctomycetes bacterium]|nr:N-acetyltransferase [Planctomycetota bacterium]
MHGFTRGQVHPTALISDKAQIGRNVTIGANVIVYDNVKIGADSYVGPHSILGEPLSDYYQGHEYENAPLVIGDSALIRSCAVIYAGSEIGHHFACGNRVAIREKTRMGHHCRVGTLSDIQGACRIGDYVSFHSNVHIGQGSVIGDYVWIFPYTVLTNDPHPPSYVCNGVTVEEFAVIATQVVVLPGVRIGREALVGAASLVRSDVPPEAVVVGVPAKQIRTVHDIEHTDGKRPAYPWGAHFERGMPWEGIGYGQWLKQRGLPGH